MRAETQGPTWRPYYGSGWRSSAETAEDAYDGHGNVGGAVEGEQYGIPGKLAYDDWFGRWLAAACLKR